MSSTEDAPTKLVSVLTEQEAAIIVASLADQGIDARAVGGFTAGFRAEAPGSVEVWVRNKDLPTAQELLEDLSNHSHAMTDFSHFDESGASRMVDVGDKPVTHRTARASGVVMMRPATRQMIMDGGHKKGDVLEVARLAGIMAAKRTAELIPLCHPLALEAVKIDFAPVDDDALRIEATVEITAKTGVEMEALTAVSVAALTVYDMCKSLDRGMVIGPIQLEEKSGGASGHYQRS